MVPPAITKPCPGGAPLAPLSSSSRKRPPTSASQVKRLGRAADGDAGLDLRRGTPRPTTGKPTRSAGASSSTAPSTRSTRPRTPSQAAASWVASPVAPERSAASSPMGPTEPLARTWPCTLPPEGRRMSPTLAAAPSGGVGANSSTSVTCDTCQRGA